MYVLHYGELAVKVSNVNTFAIEIYLCIHNIYYVQLIISHYI